MKACKPRRKGQQRLHPLQTQFVFEACSRSRLGPGSSWVLILMVHKCQLVSSAGRELGCFCVVLLGGRSSPLGLLTFPSLLLCCNTGGSAEHKDRGLQVSMELLAAAGQTRAWDGFQAEKAAHRAGGEK